MAVHRKSKKESTLSITCTTKTVITRKKGGAKEAQAALGKAERKTLRQNKGSLKDQQVCPVVRNRYKVAVQMMLSYWALFGNGPSVDISWDEAATSYVEHLYAEGDPLSLACDSLAGLQFLNTRTVGQLRHSWKLTGVWRKVEPPKRVLPLLPLMVLGMAGAAARLNMLDVAALILTGFNVFLRTSEMLKLRCCSIFYKGTKASLLLHETKTGKRKGVDERVTITSELAVRALKLATRSRKRGDLVCMRSAFEFRKIFKNLLGLFELSTSEYNVYSLRRGGATAFFSQCGSLDKTLTTGRWEHATTARMYIQEATAQASEMRLTQKQLALLREAASDCNHLEAFG